MRKHSWERYMNMLKWIRHHGGWREWWKGQYCTTNVFTMGWNKRCECQQRESGCLSAT